MVTSVATTTENRLLVFLDTNVIVMYLKGKKELEKLFSPEIEAKVQYAINPVVLQELLLLGSPYSEDFEKLSHSMKILPVDEINSKEFLDSLKTFRNKAAHANSFLILGTGKNCDYVLSYDVNMLDLGQPANVRVMKPEDFLAQMGQAR